MNFRADKLEGRLNSSALRKKLIKHRTESDHGFPKEYFQMWYKQWSAFEGLLGGPTTVKHHGILNRLRQLWHNMVMSPHETITTYGICHWPNIIMCYMAAFIEEIWGRIGINVDSDQAGRGQMDTDLEEAECEAARLYCNCLWSLNTISKNVVSQY